MTFGDESNYGRARERIVREAEGLKIFNRCIGYSERDFDSNFIVKHQEFISKHKRGYGYWIWKPHMILKTLEMMKDGDVLVYADAGCQLNVQGLNRLKEYISMACESEHGNLALRLSGLSDACWTKIDTAIAILGSSTDRRLYEDQLLSGFFVLVKCSKVQKLIEDWETVMQNQHLIDDSPSFYEKERSEFREHRHDQSVFSLLRKKYGAHVIDDETYFEGNWDAHLDKPIHARRKRT